MKVNLAAENNDVKNNYPAGNFNISFKRIKYKSQQQKKYINNDGSVTQNHQTTFQPGKRRSLCCMAFKGFMLFDIPENNSQ